jgi:hypothetical protein
MHVAVFALFGLVVMPSMKVDPEEMAKLQEEMKDSPLSFLMGGAPAQGGSTAAVDQRSQGQVQSAATAAATQRKSAGGGTVGKKRR